MASTVLFINPLSSFTRFQTARLASQREESHNARLYKHRSCVASLKNVPLALTEPTAVRRSGNYQPCIWGLDYLLSLKNEYKSEEYLSRAEKLKGDVSTMLGNMKTEPLSQLELIDDLQRLGLAYHFQEEIKNVVHNNYNISNNDWTKSDLHGTALAFRLFRQHGYHVPQEVFNQFKDRTGSFQMFLCDDIKGMLSLYEASYLSTEGEEIMEEAWDFTSKHLKNNQGNVEPNLAMLVSHALELPLHWRMQRLETRWFIDAYESRSEKNPILLELAKLDFNIVQGIHQEDLREISRCWKSTGLEEQMSFIRDTLVSSFIWGMGTSSEPQYAYCRRMVTKAIQLISAIDDFYDVYGTLDEIELFTDAIERWEISAMSQLPDYMKMCFLELYNSVNQMAYVILKEQGFDAVSNLKKAYVDLFKAYLVEARWYHSGYKPTLEEYMSNACISIAGTSILTQAYLLLAKPISEKELKYLESFPDLLHWCWVIFRLSDDLGTSSDELERGDVPKAIQCYMYDTGVSEEVARKHMKDLIREAWKKVNQCVATNSALSQTSIELALNPTKVSQYVYRHGKEHRIHERETEDQLLQLLFEPIPL